MKHFLTIRDLTGEQLQQLLDLSEQMKTEMGRFDDSLKGQFVANLFFEPSTRTRFSFEVAEKRLGAHVLNFQEEVSSTQKGETLYDTLKSLEAIGVNGAVIRHADHGILERIAPHVNCAIINAGIGSEEHPTQCLLDLLTIRGEFARIAGLKVAIVGDICHSRVARSNYYGLTKLGAQVYFAGPDYNLELGKSWLPEGNWYELDDLIEEMDVIMLLRIQHERHRHLHGMDHEEYHRRFGLTEARAHRMKSGAIIMHPGPVNRNVELASSLVESPQSRIFNQMENGVYVRMAVLYRLLHAAQLSEQKETNRATDQGGERDGVIVETSVTL